MSYTLQRPKILLFGDSLTERGFGEQGWAAGLANHLFRRVDVVNRGFGGYNTRWAKVFLKDVLAGCTPDNTKLVTIWFGANDAARPDGPPQSAAQHVPLEEYKRNLKDIVAAVRATGVTSVLLLTPPAVHDEGRKGWQVVKVGAEVAATLPVDRTLKSTAPYAQGCAEVAQELGVPCVNLFEEVQKHKDWQTQLLCDGLHFTPQGQQVVFEAVLAAIAQHFPHINPDSLPMQLPPWDMMPQLMPQLNETALQGLRQQGPFAPGITPLDGQQQQ